MPTAIIAASIYRDTLSFHLLGSPLLAGALGLLFRRTLKHLLSDGWLPLEFVLPEDLGDNGERLATLQQAGADHDLGT